MAKLLQDTPVFVITFTAQQMNIVRDRNGNIVEGDEVRCASSCDCSLYIDTG